MIYSPRGVGKTLLGLSAGYAAASSGSLFGWLRRDPAASCTLTARCLRQRCNTGWRSVAGFKCEASPDFFRMLCADVTERGLPDLATVEGQRIFGVVGDAELVILDNISTLCRSGKENEAEGWQVVQDRALAHRRAGRSLLFAHHAGKGGNQRGTSKREDVLDSVIALRRPHDYRPDQGARFRGSF